jgi:hypothetical protein
MRGTSVTIACSVAFLLILIAPVLASVSVESAIGDSVYVVFKFKNLEPSVYNEAAANTQFNSSTIPQIIVRNLKKQNLTNVDPIVQPNTYDNTTKSIIVSFYLSGSDIKSQTVNRTTLKKTYQIKTEWRNFEVNLTSSFSINFVQYFAEPVEGWQKIDNYTDTAGNVHQAYYKTADSESLGELSLYFVLPTNALNIKAIGNTVIFDTQASTEDIFLGSPFLILAVLIIVIVIALVYRRVR